MSKAWIVSGVAVVTLMAVTAWAARQPVDSSQQGLLAKAQSEFASKARDAVMQHRMAQGLQVNHGIQEPTVSAVASLPQPTGPMPPPPLTDAVLNAVKPSIANIADAPVTPLQPTTLATAQDELAKLPVDSHSSEIIGTPPSQTVVRFPEPKLDDGLSPSSTPAASHASEPGTIPTVMTQPKSAKGATVPRATAKEARHASGKLATGNASHRSRPDILSAARDVGTLRAHAPEIAAMIARYM